MSRRRAASAAASLLGANRLATSSQSTTRYEPRRRNGERRPRRTFTTSHVGARPLVGRRATSWTVSSPILASITLLTSSSPERSLKGLRSTSQDRRRAPSLSSDATRLAFTKIRRRWLAATKPSTSGGSSGSPGATTMSSKRPIGAPSASSRGSRMTRNAQIRSLLATLGTLPLAFAAPDDPAGQPERHQRHGEGPANVAGQAHRGGDVGGLCRAAPPQPRPGVDALAVAVHTA